MRPTRLLVLGAVVLAVALDGRARSVLRSPRAAGIVLGLVLGFTVLSHVLRRRHVGPAVRVAVMAVPTVAVVVLLVLPSVRQTTVTEALAGTSVLTTGRFEGIDHRASGSASIHRRPDGSLVVRLADLDVQPGPDYDVYLVPRAGARDPAGGQRLGDLKATRGDQNYELGGRRDVPAAATVLIWCEAFGVPVTAAPQAPARAP